MSTSDLPFSPAAERNQAPILAVLRGLLPRRATVLEIASGTGQHAAAFANAEPGWRWQPSDADARSLGAIAARCAALPNVASPLPLDVLQQPWPVLLEAPTAVYCANMLHIAPWAACTGLMRGAASVLAMPGLLLLYGPFLEDDRPTAPSNLAFDLDLRARDPRWGLRRLTDVVTAAGEEGFDLQQRVEMPANNLLLAFRLGARRRASGDAVAPP